MEQLYVNTNIEIAQILSSQPSKNFSEMPAMFLGRYTSSCICRILFKFPITSLPKDAIIIKAKFNITSFSNTMGMPPKKVTPYALTENWLVNTVNWKNQPSFSSDICGESLNMGKGTHNEFDITSIVRKWYNNEIPNYGIIIKNDEKKDGRYVRLMTTTNTDSGPIVEIVYKLESKCICRVIPTKFIEGIEEFDTNTSYHFSTIRDTSLTKTITYFIQNLGENSITADLQISPDGINFIEDNKIAMIRKNETIRLIPYVFAKFIRVRVKNINKDETSRVRIWFQAQE
ncbi:DNRLRE domain-containing protein [Paramaledivibacter caminithermalis]|uniref:DNRLRE domain-containing protein n=1 Tax=Paramaledivibacter caminithermalis (strain DSM 15212 / CIP 107654 / DViRD3) TaxID=1121301 RepID=A0A1M6LZ72_PARC5|nr:DNRLRE domain-containing protein [Paramaledivibacter caminithermalis]SHJ76549.1 hypothetical protein SAMN02745912_00993 [Paramaledivibacter caminithermalis DSM 15212]